MRRARTIPGMDVLGMERRRLGTWLLVFGLVGVVLAGLIAAVLVGGAVAARGLDERLAADQSRIAASLTRLTVTMESLALTTEHAGATLGTTRDTLADAQTLLGDVASTAVSLSSALDITILGNRPFSGAAEQLQALGRTVETFQADAGLLAANLDQNVNDSAAMTEQIRLMKTQVNELASQVAGFDRIDQVVNLLVGGIVVAGLLTAWVAIGAAFCAWIGWRLRRPLAAPVPVDAPAADEASAG